MDTWVRSALPKPTTCRRAVLVCGDEDTRAIHPSTLSPPTSRVMANFVCKCTVYLKRKRWSVKGLPHRGNLIGPQDHMTQTTCHLGPAAGVGLVIFSSFGGFKSSLYYGNACISSWSFSWRHVLVSVDYMWAHTKARQRPYPDWGHIKDSTQLIFAPDWGLQLWSDVQQE